MDENAVKEGYRQFKDIRLAESCLKLRTGMALPQLRFKVCRRGANPQESRW